MKKFFTRSSADQLDGGESPDGRRREEVPQIPRRMLVKTSSFEGRRSRRRKEIVRRFVQVTPGAEHRCCIKIKVTVLFTIFALVFSK